MNASRFSRDVCALMRLNSLWLAGLVLALFALDPASAQGNDLSLSPVISDLASPCPSRPLAFDFAKAPGNSVLLAWVEKSDAGIESLRIASYSALKSRWDAPRSLLSAPTLLHPNHRTELKLSMDEAGRVAVVWTGPSASGADASQVMAMLSEDGGTSWKMPVILSSQERSASQCSFTWRSGGTWLATWLESSTNAGAQLCTREAGQAEARCFEGVSALSSDATLSVSFPDGTDLISYRSYDPGKGSDPWMLRRFENTWEAPERLGREGWLGNVQARNSIRFSASAPRVAMAWFTAADDEPRILVSFSPDAGSRWTRSTRADLGHAVGALDMVLLKDGSQLVAWIEGQGIDQSLPPGILLRRYSAGGGSVRPAYVVKDETRNFPAGPRLVVLSEQTGEPVELIMAFEQGAASPSLRFLRLQMPSPDALKELDNSCNCNVGTQSGFPIRGRILSIDTAHSSMRISHDHIPGMFLRGELEVQASAALLGAVREGRGIMGRVELSEGKWLISDVRTYAVP